MMVDWIYLSPHLDDAVLSCGGGLALQARAGHAIRVVTAFAGGLNTDDEPSPFARSLHQRWELGRDAPAIRRVEDQAALTLLGVDALHWDFPECIYRRDADSTPLYPDEASLWGPLHPTDSLLIEALAQRIADLPAARLCVPLGAGGHVDHRLLRQAAESSGRALVCYEEYPYAEEPQVVQSVIVGEGWSPELVFLDEAALQAKIAALECYRSQISTFWSGTEEMGERVRAYALRVGDGRAAERRWRRTSV
jgi:LmbE family N-acetylglucosaminyl deacetylase